MQCLLSPPGGCPYWQQKENVPSLFLKAKAVHRAEYRPSAERVSSTAAPIIYRPIHLSVLLILPRCSHNVSFEGERADRVFHELPVV